MQVEEEVAVVGAVGVVVAELVVVVQAVALAAVAAVAADILPPEQVQVQARVVVQDLVSAVRLPELSFIPMQDILVPDMDMLLEEQHIGQ